MFGISFTLIPLDQAGALVHVYSDGSIHLNHGGTEIGQGLSRRSRRSLRKIGVPLQFRAHHRDRYGEGSERLADSRVVRDRSQRHGGQDRRRRDQGTDGGVRGGLMERRARDGRVRDARVFAGNVSMGFGELAKACRLSRVQLSHAGYYRTPEIHWDRANGRDARSSISPIGAACSEVAIDTLTGEMRVLRSDILHDVGASINPAIDIGQVEGAFITGMGWLTTEEFVYNSKDGSRRDAPHVPDPCRFGCTAHFRHVPLRPTQSEL